MTLGRSILFEAAEAAPPSRRLTPGGVRWVRLSLAGVALATLYAPVFPSLAVERATFPNLSHGFAIPLISGYLVWTRRQAISSLLLAPSWGGFPVLVSGLGLYAAATLGGESFLARASLPLTLLGSIWFLSGLTVTREFPMGIGYLVFMIPLPL